MTTDKGSSLRPIEVPVRARGRIKVPILIFLTCLLVYNLNCRLIETMDSLPAGILPFAILNHGTPYLDAYGPKKPEEYWFDHARNGRLASTFPIVLPVFITPLFAPAAVYVAVTEPSRAQFAILRDLMEKFAASVIAALSVVVVWFALKAMSPPRVTWILTFAYAFATQTWSTSSQALWQHGFAQLLLSCALLVLVRFGASPRWALLVGALCGLTVFNRPANASFAAAFALYYLAYGKGSRFRFASGAACAAVPFLVYNLVVFGKPLGYYQILAETGQYPHYPLAAGLAALLVSPGKGLLVYAPFFLFLLTAPVASLGAAARPGAVLLFGAFIVQLIVYSRMDWRGGYCYGPRYLADVLPLLILLLVPATERLKSTLLSGAFAACVLYGVWVQFVGVFYYPGRGSYALTMEQYWKPSGNQFYLEAKAAPRWPDCWSGPIVLIQKLRGH